jgi:hypothetical protein
MLIYFIAVFLVGVASWACARWVCRCLAGFIAWIWRHIATRISTPLPCCMVWMRRRVLRVVLGPTNIVGAVFAVCGGVLWSAFIILHPWTQESRWTNKLSLDAASVRTSANNPSPIALALANRIGPDGTLIAISISGGGSRAAYFAATMLERLSKVRWPGERGDSLIHHVDLISSVSGGSLAAAYFALNVPTAGTSQKETERFFDEFKQAMATNLEVSALRELWNPAQTLALLTFRQPMAEAIADAMDGVLDGGRGKRMSELDPRGSNGDGPILLLNATRLDTTNPFVFVAAKQRMPIFDSGSRLPADAALPHFTRALDQPKFTDSFTDAYGDLGRYRIADAVAASAAFPVALGSIALGRRDGRTVQLGDGGLVDNLGLLTLYSVLLDPDLYDLTRGRLHRIIVFSIDSENTSISSGLLAGIEGLSTFSEQALHRFVIPAMIQRALQHELGATLEDHGWEKEIFPSPMFISYAQCNGQNIPTRFRLSAGERSSIDNIAWGCFPDFQITETEKLLSAQPRREESVYIGIRIEADLVALRALLNVAEQERLWWRWAHKGLDITGLETQRPPLVTDGRDGSKFIGGDVDALKADELDATGFDFTADPRKDGVTLWATPKTYKKPGRVSFYLNLNSSLLNEDKYSFSEDIQGNVRGADNQGKPADEHLPLFGVFVRSSL